MYLLFTGNIFLSCRIYAVYMPHIARIRNKLDGYKVNIYQTWYEKLYFMIYKKIYCDFYGHLCFTAAYVIFKCLSKIKYPFYSALNILQSNDYLNSQSLMGYVKYKYIERLFHWSTFCVVFVLCKSAISLNWEFIKTCM